jgi:hypothetical protein
MQEMLKEAYTRGLTQGIQNQHPEDAEDLQIIKEALDWRRAASVFNPIKNVAQSILRPSQVAGVARSTGNRAINLAGQAARKRGLSAVGQSGLARQAVMSGGGAGIGALASDEGNRGRGAMIGALGGLGLGMGANLGGLKSFGKTVASTGRKAARQVQRGTMAPGQVQKYMTQQLTQTPLKHRVARQMIGAGVLGAGGAAGATALGSKLLPQQQAQAPEQYGQYGQAMGLTPAAYQQYPQYQGG